MGERYETWARSRGQKEATVRAAGVLEACLEVAEGLAKGKGEDGALGVAVFDPQGEIAWNAGEPVGGPHREGEKP